MAEKTKQKDTEVKTGKVLRGTVVSDKMKDTTVVEVTRYFKHPKYGKFIKTRKRYKAHDVGNTCSVGQKAEIIECKPVSKDKRFKVVTK